MNNEPNYQWRKQIVWGFMLIAIGAVFLLDRLDILDIHDLWHYWPLILVFIGLTRMIGAPTPGEMSGGLWMVFVGSWLFVVFDDRFDITFGNSWPLMVIAGGIVMVMKPLLERREKAKKGIGHE